MKNRLIDSDTEMYNSAGIQFSREINRCINSAVEKWFDENYSLRDMQVIMQTEVSLACLTRLSEESLRLKKD